MIIGFQKERKTDERNPVNNSYLQIKEKKMTMIELMFGPYMWWLYVAPIYTSWMYAPYSFMQGAIDGYTES